MSRNDIKLIVRVEKKSAEIQCPTCRGLRVGCLPSNRGVHFSRRDTFPMLRQFGARIYSLREYSHLPYLNETSESEVGALALREAASRRPSTRCRSRTKARKSRRKTLLIGLIAARGNRITAGTNCHGCATHGRSGSVSAGVSSRAGSLAGFDDAEETERRARALLLRNNAIVSSARPFHDIARDSESERLRRLARPEIKIAKCRASGQHRERNRRA